MTARAQTENPNRHDCFLCLCLFEKTWTNVDNEVRWSFTIKIVSIVTSTKTLLTVGRSSQGHTVESNHRTSSQYRTILSGERLTISSSQCTDSRRKRSEANQGNPVWKKNIPTHFLTGKVEKGFSSCWRSYFLCAKIKQSAQVKNIVV